MGESGTGSSGKTDSEEEVGLDWTHPKETNIKHHTPGPDLEPAGEKEERPASQLLEARHRSTARAAGIQLDKGSNNSPEPNGLATRRGWPMLNHERWS